MIAAVVAVGAFLAVVFSERAPNPIGPGSEAPAFALPQLDGAGPLSLASLQGHVVLLNFWASWCQPCQEEMPAMERLSRELAGTDFKLVAVSVDTNREDVVKFRKRLGLTFSILLDPEHRVSDEYQTFRYPESFLIDRHGRIRAHYVGPREWDAPAYEGRIRRLLAGTPAPIGGSGSAEGGGARPGLSAAPAAG